MKRLPIAAPLLHRLPQPAAAQAIIYPAPETVQQAAIPVVPAKMRLRGLIISG